MIVYLLIAICNAFVWSFLALLLGASVGRAVLLFILLLPLAFFLLLFMAGAAIDRKPYYLGEK